MRRKSNMSLHKNQQNLKESKESKEEEKKQETEKAINKMTIESPSLLVATLNVNQLNKLI